MFEPARNRLTGDISPVYAGPKQEKIADFADFFRQRHLFMIVRNPIERFCSALSMYARLEVLGPADYGSVEIVERLFNDPVRSLQHFPTKILERWEGALGEGELKTFFFDDIAADPAKSLNAIVRFIAGREMLRLPLVPASLNRKRRLPKVRASPEARAWVNQAFADELDRCAERFGAKGERWRSRHRPLAA